MRHRDGIPVADKVGSQAPARFAPSWVPDEQVEQIGALKHLLYQALHLVWLPILVQMVSV